MAVVKPVDAVDEGEMEAARQRADRVVRQRYAENAAREDAIEAAEKHSREAAADLNAPLWNIWEILKPTTATLFTTEFEALGMLAITLCKIFELKAQTEVMRALDRTLSSRNLVDFKAGLIRGTLVGLGGAWLRILYGCESAIPSCPPNLDSNLEPTVPCSTPRVPSNLRHCSWTLDL